MKWGPGWPPQGHWRAGHAQHSMVPMTSVLTWAMNITTELASTVPWPGQHHVLGNSAGHSDQVVPGGSMAFRCPHSHRLCPRPRQLCGLQGQYRPGTPFQTLAVVGPHTQIWSQAAAWAKLSPWAQITVQAIHIGITAMAAWRAFGHQRGSQVEAETTGTYPASRVKRSHRHQCRLPQLLQRPRSKPGPWS